MDDMYSQVVARTSTIGKTSSTDQSKTGREDNGFTRGLPWFQFAGPTDQGLCKAPPYPPNDFNKDLEAIQSGMIESGGNQPARKSSEENVFLICND